MSYDNWKMESPEDVFCCEKCRENIEEKDVRGEGFETYCTDCYEELNPPVKLESKMKQTLIQEIIKWTSENAFNVTGQDGISFIAIDHEEMRAKFNEWHKKNNKNF